MLVQIHTDPNIPSSEALTTEVEAAVQGAIGRYADRISRVQVHLEDENSTAKSGERDQRCMVEARLDGRPPLAVTHHADSVEKAIMGAPTSWNGRSTARWAGCANGSVVTAPGHPSLCLDEIEPIPIWHGAAG